MNELFNKAEKLIKGWKGDAYTFGVDVLPVVSKYAKQFGDKTLIISGNYDWLKPFIEIITSSLGREGISYGEIVADARPNAPREDVYRIALSIAKRRPDSIIAVGGGSTIDAAKAASVLNSFDVEDLEPFFGTDLVTDMMKKTGKNLLPVIAVQTASSSGAHLTKYSNITDLATGIKKIIVDEAIIPKAAVFDFKITMNSPISLILDGGLDGIAHCWEVFMGATGKSYYEEIKEITLTGVELIISYLPKLLKNPSDIVAREALARGTDLGGYAIMISKLNTKTGIIEKGGTNGPHLGSFQLIAYLSHGRASAILNPYYTVLFSDKIEDQNRTIGPVYQRLGYIDSSIDFSKLKGKELAITVAKGMIEFSKRINFPSTLKEAKVPESQIEVMVEAAKNPQVRMKLLNMPAPMDPEKGDVDNLMRPTLMAAYSGDLSLIP